MITWHTWSKSTFLLVIRKKVIYILFWRLFFIAYLSENHAFSENFYNLFWKYSKLPNEILLKYLFLKLRNKQGRPSLTIKLSMKLHGQSMLPDKAKFVECSIISLALSFWMKHLSIGQLQKPAKFSAFHWSPSWSQAFVGQLFGNQQGSIFTETNRNGLMHHIGCLITLSDRNGPILVLVSTDFDTVGKMPANMSIFHAGGIYR